MRPFSIFSAMLVIASTLTVTQPASAELSITDLGTLGGDFSWATRINNRGQIVGDSMTVSGEFRAFLWTQGTGMTNIGTLGGPDSIASDINELGQVIGPSDTATQNCVSSLYGLPATIPLDCHSFFWTVDGGMIDIGTLGGASGVASDINDVGQVVGISETALGEFHAFRWSMGSGMTDLGTLGGPYSVAANINELGQVVGQSRTTSN